MSSLAAARADNFYYPPEWRPEYGGISKFQGSKGKNQYEQYGIIRFELPFDAWCLGCKRHMCKGLRFNAKKDKDGKYFSTQIFSFSMKCPSCNHQFLIKTDPKNRTYEFVEGLRKMEQDFVPEANDSIVQILSEEDRLKLSTDKIFKLEHEFEDKTKAASANENLLSLLDLQEINSKNDFNRNSALRKVLRTEKKKKNEQLELGKKIGLNIPLIDERPEDIHLSQTNYPLIMKSETRKLKVKENSKLALISSQPIFQSKPSSIKDGKNVQLIRRHSASLLKATSVGINPSHFSLSPPPPPPISDPTPSKKKRSISPPKSILTLFADYGEDD